ncbi:cation acetate symporter [Aquibacillus koreensis]|uniref:Cation acetate symporter n=1 Tax=Aquibacillus koreensis TaxID=279446 RepID=A0A9X3WK12_9BACI|nr:cation acetate symporter [Aquibacillus koreensis]MCT2537838.1 cation acetate symporter [Aquibacillus koreensis]MDC3421130.1 cation acetate symporter [Aquibacillus koreensis]
MNLTYFIFFLVIVVGTLIITHWAAGRSNTTHQFYVASGSLTGFQNGMAIAGDYISSASFLGIAGLIAFHGYDGFIYATGFLVSYVILLFLIAEPVRNLGTYTLGDVVAQRFPGDEMRLAVAISAILISLLYMIPQLVASGLLIHILLGVDYTVAVWIIGILMTLYVVFGGMFATSWVQIIKTVLLMSGTILLLLILFSRVNWDIGLLLGQTVEQSPLGQQFFFPGNLFDSPLESMSLMLALVLGTAGLPHILIRMFTVNNVRGARLSVLTASWIIGVFYLMTLILGIGAIGFVGWDRLIAIDPSGNMSSLLLAEVLGGDFLVAFVTAVAFATIIAVVTGLVFAATSTFSHDIYFHIFKKGKAGEGKQLRVARIAAIAMGGLSILLSLGMKDSNVAFLVSFMFATAASTIMPLLILTFYWKRFNKVGAITGLATGFIAVLLLFLLGPEGYDVISLYNPGIISIPLGFFSAIIGAMCTKKDQSKQFEDLQVQIHTGIGGR